MNRKPIVIAALLVSSLCVLSTHLFASPDAVRMAQSETPGAMCPLSDSQQRSAPPAFAAMAPVFQNARCLNCHGGVNPFVGEQAGGHRGGKMQIYFKTQTEDDLAGNHIVTTVEDQAKTQDQCQQCHDALNPWSTAPAAMSFVGKDAVKLCQQMKQQFQAAGEFVAHIDND